MLRKNLGFSKHLFHTNATRFFLMTILLFVAVTAGYWASTGLKESAQVSVGQTKEADTLYRFVPGERKVYSLDYASVSASDFRLLFQDQKTAKAKTKATPMSLAQSFKTTVQGELSATVLNKNENDALMAYSFRKLQVRLIANGQEAAAEAERIRADLNSDIFATIDFHGRVLNVRFDAGVSDLAQGFARALLAITEFVLPPQKTPDLGQWETREDDPSGQYVARYQANFGSGKDAKKDSEFHLATIRKIKTQYLQPRRKTKPNQFESATTIKPKGDIVARFDIDQGHLVSLNGTESQTIIIDGKAVANAENFLHMNYLQKETLSQSELAAVRYASSAREKVAAAIPLFVAPSEEASEALIQQTELGDATPEGLLSDLASLEAATDKTDDTPLFLKFKALVYLHPESSGRFGNMLATAPADSTTMRVLTAALSAVGHAEAQASLVTAIRARPEDWPALSRLIPALGQADSPTQMAEDVLRDLSLKSSVPDISSTALLALGSIAHNTAEATPERAAKIVQLLVQAIESSSSVEATQQMLLALGNAGSRDALPVITRFVNDPTPTLRAAASTALRWIDSEQVDSLLIKTLTSDQDATVRLEAASALGSRKMTGSNFDAQKRAFQKEKNVQVRLAILSNLWNANDGFPETRRIVKQAATRDPSKEVRKAAAEIMARYTKGYFDK